MQEMPFQRSNNSKQFSGACFRTPLDGTATSLRTHRPGRHKFSAYATAPRLPSDIRKRPWRADTDRSGRYGEVYVGERWILLDTKCDRDP